MALLGRNGAGKSTTLKAIAGIAPPARGCVRVTEAEVQGRKPHVIAARGYRLSCPEDRQVFPEHSVDDNLLIGCQEGPGRSGLLESEAHLRDVPLLAPLRHRMGGICRAASNRCSPSPAR